MMILNFQTKNYELLNVRDILITFVDKLPCHISISKFGWFKKNYATVTSLDELAHFHKGFTLLKKIESDLFDQCQ